MIKARKGLLRHSTKEKEASIYLRDEDTGRGGTVKRQGFATERICTTGRY
jgi:hypothetical protein